MVWPFKRTSQSDQPWTLDGLRNPWEADRVAILDWIREHLPEDELGVLPDEEQTNVANDGLKFAPGVFDQMMRIHEEPGGGERQAADIHKALRRLAQSATDSNLRLLYEKVTEHPIRDSLEPLLARLAQDVSLDIGRVRNTGRWLASRSPDREAVKMGIAILHATRCTSE
ncbi:MAG TPA: hypothetical protein VLA89_02715, partial [Gemmatimonadales bacterium]|nr:hypothetical protein [Gemmatimonadales bacterium]